MLKPVHIIDDIYIADDGLGNRYDLLRQFGIQHVISLMPENRSDTVRNWYDTYNITHRHLTVTQHPKFPIALYFQKTKWVLDRCNHKKLVVCPNGDNHSIIVVANYIAHKYGLTSAEALKFVTDRTRCNPDSISESFKYQLRDAHDPWLRRERCVKPRTDKLLP